MIQCFAIYYPYCSFFKKQTNKILELQQIQSSIPVSSSFFLLGIKYYPEGMVPVYNFVFRLHIKFKHAPYTILCVLKLYMDNPILNTVLTF